MKISTVLWSEDRIDHIARHNVAPEEFEEICFSQSLVLRTKASGPNPVYHVLGQTEDGEYLLCIVIAMPDGVGYPVTARRMTRKEERRFLAWRRR